VKTLKLADRACTLSRRAGSTWQTKLTRANERLNLPADRAIITIYIVRFPRMMEWSFRLTAANGKIPSSWQPRRLWTSAKDTLRVPANNDSMPHLCTLRAANLYWHRAS
jgi:hypothetical protein